MTTTLTKNHTNRACTVIKTVSEYGRDRTVAVTYLNAERVWPVRDAAIDFADSLLFPFTGEGYENDNPAPYQN